MSDLSQPVPPPPGAPQQPAKKGLGPFGWILIGCGGLIVVGAIAIGGMMYAGGRFLKHKAAEFEKNPTFAAAKLAVQVNPDLEIVSSDEKDGTLTIKNKKTGEVTTMSAEEASEGRWTFKSDQGTATIDASGKDGTVKMTGDKGQTVTFGAGLQKDLPSWLPVYPGGSVKGAFDATTAEGRSAMFTVTTNASASQVLDYYETELKAAGFKVDKTTYTANNQVGGAVTGTSDDKKRIASVVITASPEGTSAAVTFQEKK